MRRSGLLFILCLLTIYLPGAGLEGWRALAAQEEVVLTQKKRNELKQMEIRKKEIQLYLKESYLAEQGALQRIQELSSDIETLRQQIVQTTQQQKHTENILSRQTKEVVHLKQQVEQDQSSMRQHVRFIYRFLKGKQALSFFEQPYSFKNQHLMELVLRHEALQFKNFYQKEPSLEKLLGPYQQRQSIQAQLFQKSSQSKELVEQKKQEHQQLVVNIQQDRQVYVRYLDELQQSMEQVIEDLDKLEQQEHLAQQFKNARGLLPLKGKLLPPVEGRLIQSFRDKKQRLDSLVSRGIIVETHKGSVVSAVASGKVVFAGALEGYRQLVIVDHGKGSFSVYGKLEKLRIALHEFVDRGTVIGQVSPELVTAKFHVYFEIRYQGKPVNPLLWFKANVYRK